MDLNGDKYIDILSGGNGGFVHFLAGKENNKFNVAIEVKNNALANINGGEYFDFRTESDVVIKKIKKPYKLRFVKAIDWDNDGDLDLVLSGKNTCNLVENIGNAKKYEFSREQTSIYDVKHLINEVVDWDGDGLWDLLCGSDDGKIYFYKNEGKLGSPKFEEAKILFDKEDFIDPSKGYVQLAQVATTDYNGDGKLDLICSAHITLYNFKSDLLEIENLRGSELLKESLKFHRKVKKVEKKYQEKYGFSNLMYTKLRADKKYNKLKKRQKQIYISLHAYISYKEEKDYVFSSLRK